MIMRLKSQHILNRIQELKKVNYPGLKNHPQYELARRQMSGFSSVLSFEIDGDS